MIPSADNREATHKPRIAIYDKCHSANAAFSGAPTLERSRLVRARLDAWFGEEEFEVVALFSDEGPSSNTCLWPAYVEASALREPLVGWLALRSELRLSLLASGRSQARTGADETVRRAYDRCASGGAL